MIIYCPIRLKITVRLALGLSTKHNTIRSLAHPTTIALTEYRPFTIVDTLLHQQPLNTFGSQPMSYVQRFKTSSPTRIWIRPFIDDHIPYLLVSHLHCTEQRSLLSVIYDVRLGPAR